MSEYLWDGTGEPDAEVERLEALLADFRHAPRTLRLPAEVAPFERRPARLFRPAWLAAAAALLLVSLAGAAAFLRARTAAEGKAAAASGTLRPRERAGAAVREKEVKASPVEPARAKAGAPKDEGAAFEDVKRGSPGRKGVQLASLPVRRQRLTTPARGVAPPVASSPSHVGSAFQAMSAGGVAPALFEGTRLMAKEQLVYALRLTGAKLRDVRLKTQGPDSKGAKQP